MPKYQIIYADPPWKFGGRSKNDPKRIPLENFYSTMSFDDLKKMNVQSISDDNCLLFLWVVSPKIKECIEVGEAWGFKYVTVAFVWHTKYALLGNYTMAGSELCLLFKKGKIPHGKLKGRGNGIKQFYEERKKRFSWKPDEIRDRIKRLFPKSERIELFARNEHQGWHVHGDEVDSCVEI